MMRHIVRFPLTLKPIIEAGINSLGRGQDVQALGQFLQVIAQTMGPEAIQQYINPDEVIKRLAAAQGIDVLNLVKSMQEIQQEQQAAQQAQQQQAITEGMPNMMKAPMLDPSKNPQLQAALGPEEGGETPIPPQ